VEKKLDRFTTNILLKYEMKEKNVPLDLFAFGEHFTIKRCRLIKQMK